MTKSKEKRLREFDVLPCVNRAFCWEKPPPMDDRWIQAVCKAAALVKQEMVAILDEKRNRQESGNG